MNGPFAVIGNACGDSLESSLESYKIMDNFHLQVTPVELTFQSKDPVSLSCLIKKVMPSGGAPERYEIRPST
jgi:hypothetical protein